MSFNSFVAYDFSWSSCGANYIGKIERTLYERTVEHAWTDNYGAVYKHLNDCTGVQHLFDIASLHSSLFTSSARIQNSEKFDLRTARINLVQDNTELIDRHRNCNILWLKEALKIRVKFWTLDWKPLKSYSYFESMVTLHTLNCLDIQLITSLTQSWQ